jgi:hypothetical protein
MLSFICGYCFYEKELDEFYRIGSTPRCKACFSKYISNYLRNRPEKAAKNREYVRKSKPRRKDSRRELVRSLKTAPCKDCGGVFHPEVMDFDHIQTGTKGGYEKSISRLQVRCVPEEELLLEIGKCELVCSNCHRIRTIRRRIGDEAYLREVDRLGTAPSSAR